ncbi:MAG: hypothetical protein IJ638_01490 [Alphaproteobacteria bacterium]|nr:hypothetical protein [Alphaproteobacteria bacterium]
MNKKDRLSNDEITTLFDDFLLKEKMRDKVERYRDNCPNYKNRTCAGDIYSKETGCSFCKENNMHNSDYAEPVYGTEEFEKLEEKKEKLRANAMRRCMLAMDDKFCEYKGTFIYCDICNKVFKRER